MSLKFYTPFKYNFYPVKCNEYNNREIMFDGKAPSLISFRKDYKNMIYYLSPIVSEHLIKINQDNIEIFNVSTIVWIFYRINENSDYHINYIYHYFYSENEIEMKFSKIFRSDKIRNLKKIL